MTTQVLLPVTFFSTCTQCHQPIRRDNDPWNNQWRPTSGYRRCKTMIGCIPMGDDSSADKL